MAGATPDNFLTPRSSLLTVRSAKDPKRERNVSRGEPLLMTARLGGGFIEVDYHRERWFAQEGALETWRGDEMARVREPYHPPRAEDRAPVRPRSEDVKPSGQVWRGGRELPMLPLVAGAFALLVAIGSLGPWASLLVWHASGTDLGGGSFTLILGLLALLVAGVRIGQPGRNARSLDVATAVLLGLAACVGIYAFADLQQWVRATKIDARPAGLDLQINLINPGWGLIVTILGSIAGALAAAASALGAGQR